MWYSQDIEGKSDSAKQRITYLARLCKWIVEHGLGVITKSKSITSFNGHEIMESCYRQHPEGRRRIEEDELLLLTITFNTFLMQTGKREIRLTFFLGD